MKTKSFFCINVLILAILFMSYISPSEADCDIKALHARFVRQAETPRYNKGDSACPYRLEIREKYKIFYHNQLIAEINRSDAYLAYAKGEIFLLNVISDKSRRSYLFLSGEKAEELVPALLEEKYLYFQIAIDGQDILFDFSRSGTGFYCVGLLNADKKFCAGEIPI